MLTRRTIADIRNAVTPVKLYLDEPEEDGRQDARDGLAEALRLLNEAWLQRDLRERLQSAIAQCASCCLDDEADRERVLNTLLEAFR